jgi:hypothetical protein
MKGRRKMRMTLLASAALVGVAFSGSAFAQGMTPEQYLQQAQQAAGQHHRLAALSAINNAENELLRSGVAEEQQGSRDEMTPPVLRQTGMAREAVQQGNWDQAQKLIAETMSHTADTTAGNATAGEQKQ